MTQTEAEILMYATTWCPDCARSKRLLDKHNVKYTWINIEEVPEAAEHGPSPQQGNAGRPNDCPARRPRPH